MCRNRVLWLSVCLALVLVTLQSRVKSQSPTPPLPTLIILDEENEFTDTIEPGLTLARPGLDVNGERQPGEGPLVGTNAEFSCGTCEEATFIEPTTQIGAGQRPCGVSPVRMVENDLLACVRSTITGHRFDLDLVTWVVDRGADCRDGTIDKSICASVGNNTSYLRTATAADLLTRLIDDVIDQGLPKGTTNSLLVKLDGAADKLLDDNTGNDQAAIDKLESFIDQVLSQRGNQIPASAADSWIASAQQIIDQLLNG